MRARGMVLVMVMLSLAVAAMALEPYTDRDALTSWIRAKCGLPEKEGSFTWTDKGFTVVYGRSPTVTCTYRILYKHSRSKSVAEYEILWERAYCNTYYLVKVNFDQRRIDEQSCMTFWPDSDVPSGDFKYAVYTF